MSPIEYIKEGILDGNWETVCEGYERLTGEILRLPRSESESNAQAILGQIKELVCEELVSDESVEPKNSKKKVGRPKKSKKKTKKTNTTVSKDGEDSSLQLDENDRTYTQKQVGEIHLITNDPDPEEVRQNKEKAARSSRNKLQLNRVAVQTYDVKCNECEDMFVSARPKGEMGQKCKKCMNDLKSRFV